MIKNAGELNRKITIVKMAGALNAGVATSVETVVCTAWASVKDASMTEVYKAAAAQIDQVVNFTIRHKNCIDVGMDVLFGGDRYRIISIDHDGYGRESMRLKTRRTEAVGR